MVVKKSISKEEIRLMPQVVFPGRVVVVQTEAEADKAVRFLESLPLVGVDTETRPSFKKGRVNQVALLQVSAEDICFLFRLNMFGLSASIVRFLENPSACKIGLSLKDDFMALRRRGAFTPQSYIELQQYVKEFGIEDNSLQKIYAILFGQKVSKSQRLSNWEADVLSDAQKAYAATDAWACYNIYQQLEKYRLSGRCMEEEKETV